MKFKKIIITLIVVALWASGPTLLQADTLVLKNGRKIQGRIVNQNRTTVTVRSADRTRIYQKRSIRRIVYSRTGTSTAAAEKRKREAARKRALARKRRAAAARRRAAEARRRANEARRIAAAKKLADEAKRKAEARRRADEERRIAAAKKLADEAKRKAEARRRADEARTAAAKKKAGEKPRRVATTGRTNSTPLDPYLPQGALYRSAILPGLGQYGQGRTVNAAIAGGAFALTGLGYYTANREWRNARRDLGELNNPYSSGNLAASALGISGLPSSAALANPTTAYLYDLSFQGQRDTVDNHARRTRLFGILFVASYAWNLADVYFFGPKPGPVPGKTARENGPRFSLNLAPDSSLSNKQGFETVGNRLDVRVSFAIF